MRHIVSLLLVLFFTWACRPAGEESDRRVNWAQVPVMIELRVAEQAPRAGLTAAMVRDLGDTVYLHPQVELLNAHIDRVTSVETADGLILNFRMTGEGRERLGRVTADNLGHRLAILIDSEVFSAPAIVQAIEPMPEIPGQVRVSLPDEQARRLVKAVSQTWPPPSRD